MSTMHCVHRILATCELNCWIAVGQNRLKIYRVLRFTFAFCLFTCVKHETGHRKYKIQAAEKEESQRAEEIESMEIFGEAAAAGDLA